MPEIVQQIVFLLLALLAFGLVLLVIAVVADRLGLLPGGLASLFGPEKPEASNLASKYKPAGPLLTQAEQQFLRALDSCATSFGPVGVPLRVFAKVRLGDVVIPDTRGSREEQGRTLHGRGIRLSENT